MRVNSSNQPARAQWEADIIDRIEGQGITRSDAQAIFDGQERAANVAWCLDETAAVAAQRILKASEPADPGRQPDVRAEARVATVATVNLDDLRRLREEALFARTGTPRWLKAAMALMDAFPGLYATAQAMNARAADLTAMVNELDATLRSIRAEDMDGSEPGMGDLLERSLSLRLRTT